MDIENNFIIEFLKKVKKICINDIHHAAYGLINELTRRFEEKPRANLMNQIFKVIMIIKCKIFEEEIKFIGEPLNHAKFIPFRLN